MTDDDAAVDITPDGSEAPIFLDPTPLVPLDAIEDAQQQVDAILAARESAAVKLRALGLTDAEVAAIIGGGM
jgi:hypothetical protein